ncbi:cephalosporin hydroxylase family protein [Clostridium estertheticum]|uniref:cephalosporin hydroxylase family protein n=1 Tax=Clostridium estertheticum TaxID=238834 RepID=UPI001CF40FB1|nr:CmcI family methyltransferase [Clostridium estertheticum]MCB2359368.1 cephalosporin hydroxylase family protein [Clostridium estertheticum]
MKLIIDTDNKILELNDHNEVKRIDLYSKEAFDIISRQWVKVGWNEKYQYTFSWLGRPIIQLPEDMIRMQEVIYNIKPDVIVETGIAHGGSLVFHASLCKAMGKGKVIGIDIDIRPHNRKVLEEHELYPFITLIEGSSTELNVANDVKSYIKKDDVVLVILDSCHTREHVYNELKLYSPIVTKGSYIVAEDGIMKDLHDVPKGEESWILDNPMQAAIEFVKNNNEFIIEQPKWIFNESKLEKNITHWTGAWMRRV